MYNKPKIVTVSTKPKITYSISQMSVIERKPLPSKKVLCVGLLNLDIIQSVDHFPEEDSDQRALEHRWQRGGNASNDCTVLSKLGVKCEFLGTISKGQHYEFLINDLKECNINIDNCPILTGHSCPVSVVILNAATGSRTIMHTNPGMPELKLADFEKVNLDEYCWIHFEGRNASQVVQMMDQIIAYNMQREKEDRIQISVELEKGRPDIDALIGYADIVFVGRDFSEFKRYGNMTETLKNISYISKDGATVISAWGERGAMAKGPDGIIAQSPAYPPHTIKDTLGAGDTFIAATIYSFLAGKSLQETIFFGCRLAGFKVGIKGYDGIECVYRKFE